VKVCERFNRFSISLLEEKAAEENTYWQSVKKFWDTNKDKPYKTLSVKQLTWMEKIEDELIKEASRSY
jgi:hypothetical protein